MKCLDCHEFFEARNSQEMLQKRMPHYNLKHYKMMKECTEEKRKIWMDKFYVSWQKAKSK